MNFQRVLIADDDVVFLNLLSDSLKSHFEIIKAENGVEALNLAQAHKPNLAILDMQMPKLDGIEVCQHLRNSKELHLMR